MSRKDTIIIAILLNAGLLIVLFATSLKSDPSEGASQTTDATPSLIQKEESPALSIVEVPKTVPNLSGDEVDQMIHQYATPPVTAAPNEIKPNFAEDVQAIGGLTLAPTPIAQEAPAVAEESSFKEVKVKKGDVLEKIARLNHVTVDKIMQLNKMSNTRLKIGQVLKVPTKSKKQTTSSSTPVQDGAVKHYTIKSGDNLWAIAVKNHMKMEDLLKLNNLTEEKARRLKAGDQIRIK